MNIGFKFRNINSNNEYQVVRMTRRSWIIKRIDKSAGNRPYESVISQSALKEAIDNGTFEDMSIKYKRIKLKF